MDTVWKALHSNYQIQEWIDRPSLFSETAIQYFPRAGRLLELGAGHGQDSFYFANQGYEVVSTDLEISTLESNLLKQSDPIKKRVTAQFVNLLEKLPFGDHSFDIVYAHLSLHYFDQATTKQIMQEIERILKPGGIIAFLTNSTDDPEYNFGPLLEPDFFQIGKISKRYFSLDTARSLVNRFEINMLDNLGQSYKDRAKGIANLIRFIGRKPLVRKTPFAISYVGGIIERKNKGDLEILIQTRWKPDADPVYSGTFEFPAGTLDIAYENVFETLAREIEEECGLKLKHIKNQCRTEILHSGREDATFGFRPFCCTQQLKNGKPWIGFVFICEVENDEPKKSTNESKDIKWVPVKEVEKIFRQTPEKMFALQLPAWEYYFAKR